MRDIQNAIGHGFPHFLVMENTEQGRPFALLFRDHLHDHPSVGGIQGCGRFIEKQDRVIGDETACDVDALLLAAGKGCWRQRPQFPRQVEFRKQNGCLLAGLFRGNLARKKRLGDDVDRRNARHGAQKLADIPDGAMANLEDGARRGAAHVDDLILVADEDLAAVDGIIAIEHFQDRAFADAGRAAEHDTFSAGHGETDIADNRQFDAIAKMHGEAFEDFRNDEGCRHGVKPAKWRKQAIACRVRADHPAPGLSDRVR